MKKATLKGAAKADMIGELPSSAGTGAMGPAHLGTIEGMRGRASQKAVRRTEGRTWRHSHSIVPGGLDVMSRTTRLTSRSSPIILEAILSSRS